MMSTTNNNNNNNKEKQKQTRRFRPTQADKNILDNAVIETIDYASSLQLADLVKYFINRLKSTKGVGLSKDIFGHFTAYHDDQTPLTRTPAGKYFALSLEYKRRKSSFLTGERLKEESLSVLGKRVFSVSNQKANVAAVREAINAKTFCGIESRAIEDNIASKLIKLDRLRLLEVQAKKTGFLDISIVWPRHYALIPHEVIEAIKMVISRYRVYGIDIRGCIKLMQDYEIWSQLLGALSHTTVCVIGLGEDQGVLKYKHMQLFKQLIENGTISIRRYFIEAGLLARRKELLRLALLGPQKNVYTVFTLAKREDALLWHSLKEHPEQRKLQPRLAWLHAPEEFWRTDIVGKAALQKSVTNYETAQSFILKHN